MKFKSAILNNKLICSKDLYTKKQVLELAKGYNCSNLKTSNIETKYMRYSVLGKNKGYIFCSKDEHSAFEVYCLDLK